jgi:hypothetical protein
MPSLTPPWPPTLDREAEAFWDRLRAHKYAGTVDALGAVRWSSDWRVHRANGLSAEEAWAVVSLTIDRIRAGLEPPRVAPGPYDVPWQPSLDADATRFAASLTALYRDEAPPDRRGPVDGIGWVRWASDYRIQRALGRDHDAAWRGVRMSILRIWGVMPDRPLAPMAGPLRLLGEGRGGLVDDQGSRLFVGCHAGDLLLRFRHDPAFVLDQLDYLASVGVQFVRTWTVLAGPWWAARAGELSPQQSGYWTSVRDFARALRARALRWQVSQGDLLRYYPSQADRRAFMRDLAQTLKEEGGLEVIASVDVGNEAWQNGEDAEESGPTPESVARMDAVLGAFLDVLPVPLATLTSARDEGQLDAYASPRATVLAYHGSRFHFRRATERAWTAGYSAKARPFLLADEPAGVNNADGLDRVGAHVSALERPADWRDLEAMGVYAAAHYTTRQLYTVLTSPGVISDEPFEQYPAIAQSVAVAARLPADVQSWRVFHGGEGRDFSPDRILAVSGDETRCEHATDGHGHYVVLIYADRPGSYSFRAVNGFEGVAIDPGTLTEVPIRFSPGAIVTLGFRRGRILIGSRR